ncbi:uncharacterized protein [Brachyistius frenatus]|uniref:uncharacterized protein isoform X1 n=1 Tax=Brachyistius frenatus TaxID=100188 RepID=UPI0037E77CF4
MDKLETPYEEETEFIECTVCEKSIRGETLYKIHVTTPGHVKKEDALVAAGLAVRRPLPEFKDILEYLDYLKLDEPIIGLSHLDELPFEPQADLRYTCRLCHLTSNLSEMVHHVIGRKHRQKYVELKRQDLVTWDKQSIMTQGGKIIRARAEIIERQDGRGSPVLQPAAKKEIGGKFNTLRVLPRQRQNMDRRTPQRMQPDMPPPLLPELKDYSQKRKNLLGYPNPPGFHPEEANMNRDRQPQRQDMLNYDRLEEGMWGADYRTMFMSRGDNVHSEFHQYGEYLKDPKRSAVLKAGDVFGYDYRGKMPHGQPQCVDRYPGKDPSYKRPYPENDPLKEFYSEEVQRGQALSAEHHQHSQMMYPEGDKQRWSLEREAGRRDAVNRAGSQESSGPEAKRRSFYNLMESDRSRDQFFDAIRDYRHEMRNLHQQETIDNTGPSRAGAPTSQREVELTRTISDIPEPFRRFLERAANDEGHGKRQRESRFSDASPEELEMTKEMFGDKYGPPNPKFGADPRPVSAPLRPEISGTQYSNLYRESQSPHHPESYQRRGSDSNGVFDMLKNIEIENAEEADFLKNKLCSLLKEFKTKKSEKAAQNSQSRSGMSRNHSDLKLNPQLPPRHQYEKTPREDSDHRQPEDLYFKDDHRRGWNQQEHIPDERSHEYHRPLRGKPRHPNRGSYEDVFGAPRMNHLDEPSCYPERFQGPMRPHEHHPAGEGFFDSSARPLNMEHGPRNQRGPRYSNNLDKITSTLLELVARK